MIIELVNFIFTGNFVCNFLDRRMIAIVHPAAQVGAVASLYGDGSIPKARTHKTDAVCVATNVPHTEEARRGKPARGKNTLEAFAVRRHTEARPKQRAGKCQENTLARRRGMGIIKL